MLALRTALAIGLVAASITAGGLARAQSPADLAAGRQLFVEALADEEHGRFAEALAKYKRVLTIKDTGNIRFRMGSSLERLGKIVQAVDAYTAAVRLSSEGDTPADNEVVRAAQARLDALRPKIAHVTLRLPTPPPEAVEVTVDGEPVPPAAFADLALDPGAHVVAATAKAARPFRAPLDLHEGARVDVPIVLESEAAPVPAPPKETGAPYRTIGIVTGAAGGVLLIGGIVVLALRSSDISKLQEACPNGSCPANREDELRSTQDRAKLEGPLGAALLITGGVALGAGAALFALSGSEKKTAARVLPVPLTNGAMLTFARGF